MLLFGMFCADFVEYGHHATGRRLEGVLVMFTLLPAAGAVLGALVMYRFYSLTEVQAIIDRNQQNPSELSDGG